MAALFHNRAEAGASLAAFVAELGLDDPVVLALPRGGVPVAAPVARRLSAPLDLLMVRKLGMPGQAELAAGAVVEGAGPVFNREILAGAGLSETDFRDAVEEKRAEMAARRARYLGGRVPVPVAGRDVVVVDDGIATGATMRAALSGLSFREPGTVTLAVPVAPPGAAADLGRLADHTICLALPHPFHAVSAHYARFGQVPDSEVVRLLGQTASAG